MIEDRGRGRRWRRAEELAVPEAVLLSGLPGSPNVIVLAEDVGRRTTRALAYGARLSPRRLSGLHLRVNERSAVRLQCKWERRLPEVLLTVIDADGGSVAESLRPMVEVEAATEGPVVVVVPERRNPAFGVSTAGGSLEILSRLHDIPNTWVIMIPL